MKTQRGDILVFHSHSFISVAIQFFTNIWRWVNLDFKPFYKSVPNHIAIGVNDDNIIEARAEGVVISPFNRYLKDKGKTTIKIYRYYWSLRQKKQMGVLFDKYEGVPYQYSNFLFFIIYIFTFGHVWLGRRGKNSDKKLYCSELATRIIHDVTSPILGKTTKDNDAHVYFKDYWKITPYQLDHWCQLNCELVTVYEINNGVVTELPTK